MTRAPVQPRLMTKAEASAYCGMTLEHFEAQIGIGKFRPVPFASGRFDRRLIDAALAAPASNDSGSAPLQAKKRRRSMRPRVVELRVKPWTTSPLWAKLAYFNARKNSEKRGIDFHLTREEMDVVVTRCDGRCELSGIPFEHAAHASAARRPFAPSLDRRDSAKGYEAGNVRIICVIANLALNQWGDDALVTLARAIVAKADGAS